eukprot:3662376-Prymnesium_polylepis.1
MLAVARTLACNSSQLRQLRSLRHHCVIVAPSLRPPLLALSLREGAELGAVEGGPVAKDAQELEQHAHLPYLGRVCVPNEQLGAERSPG